MSRRATAGVAAMLAIGVMAMPGLSADGEEAVEWVQATCTVEPGDESSDAGMLFVHGEKHHDTIYMDLGSGYVPVGTNLISMDYDLSLETGDGQGGGTFLAELPGLDSSFSGHFNGDIRAGMLTARAVGDGSGAMAGAKLEGRIVQFSPTGEQLAWMCGGEDVNKAVKVTARILPAASTESPAPSASAPPVSPT
jgi:hypothetical protein